MFCIDALNYPRTAKLAADGQLVRIKPGTGLPDLTRVTPLGPPHSVLQ
jgi:hypothetical protein